MLPPGTVSFQSVSGSALGAGHSARRDFHRLQAAVGHRGVSDAPLERGRGSFALHRFPSPDRVSPPLLIC